MRVLKDRSWVGEMTRVFEAEKTACAELWVPGKKKSVFEKKFSVAGA